MTDVVGSASVEIEADTRAIDRDLVRAVRSAAEDASREMERTFERGIDGITQQFGRLDASAFEELTDGADESAQAIADQFEDATEQIGAQFEDVSEQIVAHFEEAAESSDAALGEIGEDAASNIETVFDSATDGIVSAFEDAASGADAALDGIGEGAFEGIVAEAEAAAAGVEAAFEGITIDVGEQFSDMGAQAQAGFDDITQGSGAAAGAMGGLAARAGPAAAAIGGLFAIGSLTNVTEAFNSQVAITDTLLRNQGEAAQFTTGELVKLAKESSVKIGVDATDLLAAQNLVLRFGTTTQDNFRATMSTAADLAAVMGTNVSGAANILGRALQDPERGMTLLRRSIGSLTDEQEALVKGLVESGDAAGAQAALLDILNTAVGGAAEASADSTARISAAFQQLLVQAGGPLVALLDAVTPLLLAFDGALIKIIAGGALLILSTMFLRMAASATLATTRIIANTVAMGANAAAATGQVVAAIGRQIVAWIALGTQALLAAARVALAWIIALGPIAIVIAAVIGLTVLVVRNWDTIRDVTLRVFGAIGDFFSGLWEGIKNVFSSAISTITDIFARFGPAILALLVPFIGIPLLIRQHWDTIQDALAAVWEFLQGVATRVFGFLRELFLNFTPVGLIIQHWETIRSFLAGAWEAIRNAAVSAFERMRQAIVGAIEAVVALVRSLPGRFLQALGNIGSALVQAGKDLIQGLINGIKGMAGRLRDALIGLLPGPLRRFAGALGLGSPSKLFRGFGQDLIEGLILGIEDEQQRLMRAMERLAFDVGDVSVDALTIPAPGFGTSSFPSRSSAIAQPLAAGGVVQNITVNEVAEDPVATARRIAFELGTQSVR